MMNPNRRFDRARRASRFAWFARLMILALSLFAASTASAQADEQPLTIEKPSDGEVVETPFTVSGSAPAGRQLELWVGPALERVFRADSDGRFSAAVTEDLQGSTKITVHLIGARGQQVESVSVSVDWGGEADERDVLVGTPPDPPALDAPAEAGAPDPPAPNDQPNSSTETTSPSSVAAGGEALPSADELLTGPGDPPPPWEAERAVEPTDDESAFVADTEEPYRPRRSPPSQGVRGLAAAGAGLGAGIGGGFILGLGGLGLGVATDAGFAALAYMVIGGLLGYAIGIPVGVTLVGNALQGNGKLAAVVLGELVGTVAAFALTVPIANAGGGGGLPLLFFATMPTGGAAIGYELTSDRSRYDTDRVTFTPAISPSRDGRGATVGFRLTF